jgi:hypothetical protein
MGLHFRASPQYDRYIAPAVAAPAARSPAAPTEPRAGLPEGPPLRQFGILARRYLDLIVRTGATW